MTDLREFRLPDVGEGLTEAEVIAWHVAVGDRVEVNQVLVEIETAKAAVELPSPFAGVVTALLVEPGVAVPIGTAIVTIDVRDEAALAPAAALDSDAAAPDTARADATESAPSTGPSMAAAPEQWAAAASPAAPEAKREAVLVGYGVAPSSATRRPRRPRRPTARPTPTTYGPVIRGDSNLETAIEGGGAVSVRAKPPVRKRAKELGIDLAGVTPTGPHGDITRADVEGATALALGAVGARTGSGSASGDRVAREERIPVRGVLRSMADAMVLSASTAPHVTEWVAVDVTATMRLGQHLRALPEFDGATVGPTLVAAWALCRAVGRYPRVNASWDESAAEVVVKHYVNLGIAAATPRGLVVPVIKDAEALDLAGLAHALTALTTTARAGTTAPADMIGGTISITNVGVFGVDGGTPILVPGQGAILGLGQVAERPWVVDGVVVPRSVCELTLSFDHRFVDGELGSRVLADVAATMADPTAELVRASLRGAGADVRG